MKSLHIGLALLASSALCGCAEFPHVDAGYGHAYSAMVREQTADPQAASQSRPPAPAQGARLENVLKAHTSAVSSAVGGKVKTGEFQVGGSGGGAGGG